MGVVCALLSRTEFFRLTVNLRHRGDRVILKFEARVQIYMAVLNIGCKIQNSAGNVVSFSKINSCEMSFYLFLFKNMRIIRYLGVW